jgi:hypothetical protein
LDEVEVNASYHGKRLGAGARLCVSESCVGTDHVEFRFSLGAERTTLPGYSAAKGNRPWNLVLDAEVRYINEPFEGWIVLEALLPSETPGLEIPGLRGAPGFHSGISLTLGGSFLYTRSG